MGSFIQFALASRYGAAATGAAVNTAAQLIENHGQITQVDPFKIAGSALTASLGLGGGPLWNFGLGTAVGGLQTEASNLFLGKDESVLVGAATGGIATGAGFLVGDKLGGVKSISLNPVIVGNVAGSVISEVANGVNDKIHENKITKKIVDNN